MEYVSGRDLKRVVEDAKAKGEEVPVWWAVQRIMAAAEGLGHAHSRGYIHRDVKPNNIMITDDDQVKVLDLGLAKVVTPDLGKDSRLTQMAMGLGTPSVMPPEQWADAASVSAASDIYSLGCTFFYLLTGQMPFHASNMRELMYCHMSEPPPKAANLRSDVPPELDAVIAKMLDKKPEERYQSVPELLEAMEPFSYADDPLPPPGPPIWKYAAVGVLGVAALAVAGVMMFKPSPDPSPKKNGDPPVITNGGKDPVVKNGRQVKRRTGKVVGRS
jgi:serine/threonine protein kinase